MAISKYIYIDSNVPTHSVPKDCIHMSLLYKKYDDIERYFDELRVSVDLKMVFSKLRDMFAIRPLGISGYMKIGQHLSYLSQVLLFFGKNLQKTGGVTSFPQLLFEYHNKSGLSNIDFFQSVYDSFPEPCRVLVDERHVDHRHMYHVLVDGVEPTELFDHFNLSHLKSGHMLDIASLNETKPLKILYTFPHLEAVFHVFEAIHQQIALEAALMGMNTDIPVELHLSFQKMDGFAIGLVYTPIEQEKTHMRLIANTIKERKKLFNEQSLLDGHMATSRGPVATSEYDEDPDERIVDEDLSFGGQRRSTEKKTSKRVQKSKTGGRRESRSQSRRLR